MSGYGCFANFMPEYDGMDINQFIDYCIANSTSIYVVERGRVVNLAEARHKTCQMWKLWNGRFTKKED